jgi:hypothetical protein
MTREYFYRAPHSIVFAKTLHSLYNNHKTNFDGVTIGAGNTRHTSLDWFLVPKERPSIEKAPVKEHYIDIPGTNGGLDLTESLTGFPLYDYIEGSFEFTILNDRKLITVNNECEKTKEIDISWEVLNRDIREFLNGKQRYMMLEDDPSWYYVGRFTVEKYDSSDSANSKITIAYKVYPFKKLSTYFTIKSPTEFRESFFDANPLSAGDTRNVINSTWNKVSLDMYPGDNKSWNGSTAGMLPCGSESVSISFAVDRKTTNLTPYTTFERPNQTVNAYLDAPTSTRDIPIIKPRGFILTNRTGKGILYSDNTLTLSLSYPEAYDSRKSYSKGDVVSYHHVVERPLLPDVDQHITWIMIAKEDISEGSSLDLSKWEVDETAILFKAYDQSKPYNKGYYAYIYSNTLWGPVFALIKATENIPADTPFDPTQWELVTDEIPMKDIFYPVKVSVIYDIGVM